MSTFLIYIFSFLFVSDQLWFLTVYSNIFSDPGFCLCNRMMRILNLKFVSFLGFMVENLKSVNGLLYVYPSICILKRGYN